MDIGAEAYRRFLMGDDHGLEQVIDMYKDSLMFFIMQYVRNPSIAEELTEDTFVAIAVRKPKFREDALFRTWLFTIARNKALNYLKSPWHRRRIDLSDIGPVSDFDCPEQRLLQQERYRELYSAIEKLPKNQREMVYLFYFEDMSIIEAAAVIHKSRVQGSSILARARRSLKSILTEEGFDNENIS